MDKALSLNDYWFLEVLVHFRVPVQLLSGSQATLQEQWNRNAHQLGKEAAVHRLIELWRNGLLLWSRPSSDDRILYSDDSSIADEQLFRTGSVGITAIGGEAWEAWAEPDWSRFLTETSDCNEGEARAGGESGILEILAGSRRRLEEALWVGESHWGVRLKRDDDRFCLSERIPFQATYWKVLPSGFVCRVPFIDDTDQRHLSGTTFWQWMQRGFSRNECVEVYSP